MLPQQPTCDLERSDILPGHLAILILYVLASSLYLHNGAGSIEHFAVAREWRFEGSIDCLVDKEATLAVIEDNILLHRSTHNVLSLAVKDRVEAVADYSTQLVVSI